MIRVEERTRQVDGLTHDAAAPELRQQFELILTRQMRGVLFRQSQEEGHVDGDVSQMYLAQ